MSMQLNVTVNPVFNSSVFTAAGSKAGASFASGLNSSISKSQPLGRITGQVSEFQKSVEAANARVLAFGASAGSIYVIKTAFDKLISSTIQVEKSITEINSVLGLGGSLLKNFSNEIFKAASLTGQTFETASKVALEFSRQGAGAAETAKRMTAALQLMRVSGLSADDSVNSITASLNAFTQEGLTAEDVVNRLAAVDMKFAVSSRDLANAIQRVGSVANDAGIQFNELLGLVTAAQTITARGGSVIGNAFKSIFTRLARPQVLDDLKSVGIETRDASGQILPMITVLKNLAKQYDSLAPSQKSFVAESVGGVYQINILKAALMDLGSGLSIFDRATLTASQSAGMMEERMEELNNTISSKLNASANELMRLFANIGQLTIGSSMKGALDDVAKNISFINNLLSEVEPDDSIGEKFIKTFSRGIMKGLGGIVSGPGVFLVASLLTKVFADIGKFAIQSSKEFLGMNDALNKQRDIVNSIQLFLSQNPKILDAIKSGQLNINDAHLIYLKQLQQENKLKEENLAIATTMAGKAAPYITASKPKNAASGFVPNFAETEAQAERRMAISHGYSPGPVFKTLIHDGNGGASLSTVNGAEKIKTVTNEKGYKATFVIPPNGFGKNTQFAAAGFAPNFEPQKIGEIRGGRNSIGTLKRDYPKIKAIYESQEESEGIDDTDTISVSNIDIYKIPFNKKTISAFQEIEEFRKNIKISAEKINEKRKTLEKEVLKFEKQKNKQNEKTFELTENVSFEKGSSAVDIIGEQTAIEVKSGKYNKKEVREKFYRYPVENNPELFPYKGKFNEDQNDTIYSPDNLKLYVSPSQKEIEEKLKELKELKENKASGFVPNFGSKVGVVTGDALRGNQYKKALEYLANTNKPVTSIVGPAGSGKTSRAVNEYGGEIIKSTNFDDYESFVFDRAGFELPEKDKASAENIQKILRKSGSIDVLISSRDTLAKAREKRAGEGDQNIPERSYFKTGSGGAGTFVKGVRQFLSENENAKVFQLKQGEKGFYHSQLNLASGFIPNFAEQTGPPNPQGKISAAAITAGSFQQVWDEGISKALAKEDERKIKAGIKKGTPTTEEANLRLRYEETAGTALTNYLESSPELAYTKILQRFHTNTLPGGGSFPGFDYILDTFTNNNLLKNKLNWKDNYSMEVNGKQMTGAKGKMLLSMKTSRANEKGAEILRKMELGKERLRTVGTLGAEEQTSEILVGLYGSTLSNQAQAFKEAKKKLGRGSEDYNIFGPRTKFGRARIETQAAASGFVPNFAVSQEGIEAMKEMVKRAGEERKKPIDQQNSSILNEAAAAERALEKILGSSKKSIKTFDSKKFLSGLEEAGVDKRTISTLRYKLENDNESQIKAFIYNLKTISSYRSGWLDLDKESINKNLVDKVFQNLASGFVPNFFNYLNEARNILKENGLNLDDINNQNFSQFKDVIKNKVGSSNIGEYEKALENYLYGGSSGWSLRKPSSRGRGGYREFGSGFVPNFFNYLNEARNILKENGLNLDDINNQNFSQFKDVIKSKVGGTNIGEYEKALENYLYGGSTGWSLKKPSSKGRGGYREFGSGFVPNFALPDFGANQNITLSKSQIEDALKKAKTTGNYEGLEHLIYQSLTSKIGTGKDLTPLQKNISKEEKEAYAASLNNVDKNNGAWAQWDVKKTGNKPSDKRIDNYKSYFSMDFNSLMALNKNGAELKQKLTPLTEKYGMDLSFKVPGGALSGLTHNDSLVVHYTNNQAAQEVEQTVNDFIKSKKMSLGTRAYNRGIDLINKNVGLPTKDSLGRQTPVSSYGGYLAKQITHDLASGTSLQESISKRIKNAFASGFVPNFNSKALAEAKNREMAAGYSSSEVKVGYDSRLKKSGGVGVYNKDEGSLANAINMHLASGKDLNEIQTQGAASGFVPNFGILESALLGVFKGLADEFKKSENVFGNAIDKLSAGYNKQLEGQKKAIDAESKLIASFNKLKQEFEKMPEGKEKDKKTQELFNTFKKLDPKGAGEAFETYSKVNIRALDIGQEKEALQEIERDTGLPESERKAASSKIDDLTKELDLILSEIFGKGGKEIHDQIKSALGTKTKIGEDIKTKKEELKKLTSTPPDLEKHKKVQEAEAEVAKFKGRPLSQSETHLKEEAEKKLESAKSEFSSSQEKRSSEISAKRAEIFSSIQDRRKAMSEERKKKKEFKETTGVSFAEDKTLLIRDKTTENMVREMEARTGIKKKESEQFGEKYTQYRQEVTEKRAKAQKIAGRVAFGAPMVLGMASSIAESTGNKDAAKAFSTLSSGASMAAQAFQLLPGPIGATAAGLILLKTGYDAMLDWQSGIEASREALEKHKNKYERTNSALSAAQQSFQNLDSLYKSGSTSLSQFVAATRQVSKTMIELASINPQLAAEMSAARTPEEKAQVQARYAQEETAKTETLEYDLKFREFKRSKQGIFGDYTSGKYGAFTAESKEDVSKVEKMATQGTTLVLNEILDKMSKSESPEERGKAKEIRERVASGTATGEDIQLLMGKTKESKTFSEFGQKEAALIKLKLEEVLKNLSIPDSVRKDYLDGLAELNALKDKENAIRRLYNQELQNLLSQGTKTSYIRNKEYQRGMEDEKLGMDVGYYGKGKELDLRSLVTSEYDITKQRGEMKLEQSKREGALGIKMSKAESGERILGDLSESILGDLSVKTDLTGGGVGVNAPSEGALKEAKFWESIQNKFSGKQDVLSGRMGAQDLLETVRNRTPEEASRSILGSREEAKAKFGIEGAQYEAMTAKLTTKMSGEDFTRKLYDETAKMRQEAAKNAAEQQKISAENVAATKAIQFKELSQALGGLSTLKRGGARQMKREMRRAESLYKYGRTEEARAEGALGILQNTPESRRNMNNPIIREMYGTIQAARTKQNRELLQGTLLGQAFGADSQNEAFYSQTAAKQTFGNLKASGVGEDFYKNIGLEIPEEDKSETIKNTEALASMTLELQNFIKKIESSRLTDDKKNQYEEQLKNTAKEIADKEKSLKDMKIANVAKVEIQQMGMIEAFQGSVAGKALQFTNPVQILIEAIKSLKEPVGTQNENSNPANTQGGKATEGGTTSTQTNNEQSNTASVNEGKPTINVASTVILPPETFGPLNQSLQEIKSAISAGQNRPISISQASV